MKRRSFITGAFVCSLPTLNYSQGLIPIADAHNHLGLLRGNDGRIPMLGQLMKESGVNLLSWSLVSDYPFLGLTKNGIGQYKSANVGDFKASYNSEIEKILKGLIVNGVKVIKNAEDLQQSSQETPYVCLTAEGADFLEGNLDFLGQAYEQGIRHVQLVHYCKNPIGDIQTERPEHGGLTAFGKDLVAALNQHGMLIDLAHSTSESVGQALELSKVPVIWSHSYISESPSSWTSSGYRSRALSLKDAKKIADAGGAVGLWGLGVSFGGGIYGYVDEILRMINLIGADHVMFGSDQDGLAGGAVINRLYDLRFVVDTLIKKGLNEKTIRAVAFENYARCLKTAMTNRSL